MGSNVDRAIAPYCRGGLHATTCNKLPFLGAVRIQCVGLVVMRPDVDRVITPYCRCRKHIASCYKFPFLEANN